jgi:hypothetical protein
VPAEQKLEASRDAAPVMQEMQRAPAAAGAGAPAAPAPSRLRAQTDRVESEAAKLAHDPDAWIARIRKLRDDGNTAQAMRELREFRSLVPDAEQKLPPDLRALQP